MFCQRWVLAFAVIAAPEKESAYFYVLFKIDI
jgi:hypothetical protein